MARFALGILGFGNMASAIAASALGKDLYAPEDICVFDADSEKNTAILARGFALAESASDVVLESEMILLAVKPQVIAEVCADIAPAAEGKTFISIAAGISAAYIKTLLGADTHVVTVMPNTPIMLGCGATAIAKDPSVPDAIYEKASRIFEAAGLVEFVPQEKMNEIICLNASSPAYFFRMADVMANAGAAQGIDRDTALRLVAKAMEGAAKMLMESGESPSELESKVTSLGGTTFAALQAMDKRGFSEALLSGMSACTKRAYELGK
ncbi:pyrroline-5-carboxylate reductase [Oscillospiraceae bacterium OttesenSCG-928-F05]|nr:pyrroline-5-carboxylate reductase [Oscillospiraceae bacterium OttesenSCG-928-F05]